VASKVLALKAPTPAPTASALMTLFSTALVAQVPTDAATTTLAPTAPALTAAFGYGSDSAKMMPLAAPAPAPASQYYNFN
jgi:hypothetical protein